MDFDNLMRNSIRNSEIYGFNSKRGILQKLGLHHILDPRKLETEVNNLYSHYYIRKRKGGSETKDKRIETYVDLREEKVEKIFSVPSDHSPDKYRKITYLTSNVVKRGQRKLNKILSKVLFSDFKKKEPVLPYLHSSTKKRSFITNSREHLGNRYLLAIDLRNFYPSIDRDRVFHFFRTEFNLDIDVAKMYSLLLTSPREIDDGIVYTLGQGLSTSPICAVLINFTLFNYIYSLSAKYNITMTVYVDDITFSSDDIIPQEFIDKLFGLIKRNSMEINKGKIHYYKMDSTKKITGIYINGNVMSIRNGKHEEIITQYNYLKNITVHSYEQFLFVYNIFLRFAGNVQFLEEVEGLKGKKYLSNLVSQLRHKFPSGLSKIRKNSPYMIGNLPGDTDEKLREYYSRWEQ